MTRIEREKKIVGQMIAIYCKKRHGSGGGHLCNECEALFGYAMHRLDHCPKGNSKTSCRKCSIHCYAPDRREAIRRVMRYVGPRMIFIHPISAIRHLLAEIHTSDDKPVIIKTDRIVIRSLTHSDLEALHSIMAKPEVMYAWEHGFTKAEVSQWICRQLTRYKKDGFGYFAVISKQSGKLIGQAGLMRSEFNGTPVVELGYIFDNSCWHNGYATEASKALLEYGFRRKHLNSIYCSIRPMNVSSIHVAERLGMKCCGEHIVNYRGQDMPHLIFVAKSSYTGGKNQSFSR